MTVAKSVELEDKYENIGARLVQVLFTLINTLPNASRMSPTRPTTLLETEPPAPLS